MQADALATIRAEAQHRVPRGAFSVHADFHREAHRPPSNNKA
jgi:hypothetical protein